MLNRLLNSFVGSESLAIHVGNSRVRAFSASARLEIMVRLKAITTRRYGMKVLVCACKPSDNSSGSCHISGRWPSSSMRDPTMETVHRKNGC